MAWRGAREREEDVDVLVYSTLLDERRRHWAGRHLDAAAAGDRRLAAALTQGAGLDEWQVEQVLRVVPGALPDGGSSSPASLDQEWDEVYRAPVPMARIHQALRRTRRRRLVAGAGLLVAAVVVAAVVLVVRPDEAPAPEPPEPPAPRNPVAIAWASNDVLNLDRVEVDTPGLVTLTQVGDDPYGAVHGDDAGRVVQVHPDGRIDAIGRTPAGRPIVGSPDGIVAWVEPGRSPAAVWGVARATVARASSAGTPWPAPRSVSSRSTVAPASSRSTTARSTPSTARRP